MVHIKIPLPNGVFPELAKKKVTPQETVVEEESSENNGETGETSIEGVPLDEGEHLVDQLDNWPELQRLLSEDEAVENLFEKGWRPILKTKPNGKQYGVLRFHGIDQGTGEYKDTERGLGVIIPENSGRWDTLLALFETVKSQLPLPPANEPLPSQNTQPPPSSKSSSVLSSKVARIAPITPSVQISLGTLQWYTWVQQACDYPGKLEDFINDTVDSYFRAHHHLELAVIIQGE